MRDDSLLRSDKKVGGRYPQPAVPHAKRIDRHIQNGGCGNK
jgi:hypothetical protein